MKDTEIDYIMQEIEHMECLVKQKRHFPFALLMLKHLTELYQKRDTEIWWKVDEALYSDTWDDYDSWAKHCGMMP